MYALHTNGIPGRDKPRIRMTVYDVLPEEIGGQDEAWVTRAVYNSRAPMPVKILRRTTFPSQHQWNGETKAFENYSYQLQGWLMQSGMGYMFDQRFVKEYRLGV
jgi:hypothetical protein